MYILIGSGDNSIESEFYSGKPKAGYDTFNKAHKMGVDGYPLLVIKHHGSIEMSSLLYTSISDEQLSNIHLYVDILDTDDMSIERLHLSWLNDIIGGTHLSIDGVLQRKGKILGICNRGYYYHYVISDCGRFVLTGTDTRSDCVGNFYIYAGGFNYPIAIAKNIYKKSNKQHLLGICTPRIISFSYDEESKVFRVTVRYTRNYNGDDSRYSDMIKDGLTTDFNIKPLLDISYRSNYKNLVCKEYREKFNNWWAMNCIMEA